MIRAFRPWLLTGFCAVLLGALLPEAFAQRGVLSSDFADLYDKQAPAVVGIDVTQKIKHPPIPDLPENHPFYDFFRRFGQIPRGAPREFERQSVASGFIVSSDGYVITNAHVVDGADGVTVKLADGREFKARVVGADKQTDVALLRIDASNLPTVTIGDPDKLRVGQWVVAIGKPFGLENSMTAGIVSAKGRDLPDEDLVPFIQTDAAVNPGNSGGPLLNMSGEVVGITSMIYSESGGYMGISFAIPIDIAMNAAAELKAKGRVTRGRIGIDIAEVTSEAAESFGLPKPAGALVNSVEKGGPADKGGIVAGDIILAVDGREVPTYTELPRIITSIKPGTPVSLAIWRDGARRSVAVTVAESGEEGVVAAQRPGEFAPKQKPQPNRLGLALSDLADARKKELEVANGVLIAEVSAAVRGDVQPGDVILAVVVQGRTTPARSADQVNALLSRLDRGASVTLRLKRNRQEFFSSQRIVDGE